METRKKSFSLRTKLAFFATILVVSVAVSLSTYIRQGQKKSITAAQEENRIQTTQALWQVAQGAILMDDDTAMVNYTKLLVISPKNAYAMVLFPNNNVRVHTNISLMGLSLKDEPTRLALAHRSQSYPLIQHLKNDEGRDIIDLALPLQDGDQRGVVRMGFDKAEIDKAISASLKQVDRRILTAFMLALLLGIAGAFLLATLMTRPIRILRRGAQKIGEGKLDHRISVKTRDELGELADEFNLMAQKLGELDQMKQDFVSNVTHELRSPMTSIRGYMDLLLNGGAGNISGLQRDYLSVIKNNAVRLGRFIDNLLDVAKIEAHRLKLTPAVQNLHQLAHEMVVLFKPQADEKAISLRNEIPPSLTDVFVDRDKVAEVLINLTSNAIKFTPEGGTIRFTAEEKSNHVVGSVEDSGAGIPPDMIEKVFSKFEQIKSTQGLARKHKGTGLGLTIVKGIIEAHGGKVWVESPTPKGRGTVFRFSLPKVSDDILKKLQTPSS